MIPTISDNLLKRIAWITAGIWLALQIVLVVAFEDMPLTSDSRVYADLGREMARSGAWYPTAAHIEGTDFVANYIIYPGLINFYALLFRVFGTVRAIFGANIVLNILFALSIGKTAAVILNRRAGYMALILFCLCPQNVTDAALALSELPALALACSGAALCCMKRPGGVAAGGVLGAAAIYFRPTSLLIPLAAILYMIPARCPRRRIAIFIASGLLTCLMTLWINREISGGYSFLSSNTLGVNMIQGAIDGSSGGPQGLTTPELDHKLAGRDAFECDSIYKGEAIRWIKANPGKWSRLALTKLRRQFTPDSMIGMSRQTPNPLLAADAGVAAKSLKIIWLNYPLVYYPILALLALAGIIVVIRRKEYPLLALLLPVAATLALCILTVGAFRYNATFLPAAYILAALPLATLLPARKKDVRS